MSTALRPVLGVISCNRFVSDGQPAQAVMTRYLDSAMEFAEAAALLIPAMPNYLQARDVAPRLDGLLLTGSPSNLNPEHYGEVADDAPGPFDPQRDVMTMQLVKAMLDLGKPVFGICRGFQELNVAFGGSLRRDVGAHPELIPHHGPSEHGFDQYFDHTHPVQLAEGGLLARAYGRRELNVISVHYQGVARLAPGLKVEATAPDGMIEAVSAEVNGAQVLAVQWHPDWKAREDEDRQIFFRLMGRALRGEKL